MLKEGELIGAISHLSSGGPAIHRQADRAGAEFAAQAVIAIENTRLLNELREVAGAADSNIGGVERHQLVAR